MPTYPLHHLDNVKAMKVMFIKNWFKTLYGLVIIVIITCPIITSANGMQTNTYSLTPKIQWIKTFGNGYVDEARAVAIDDLGVVYIAVTALSYQKNALFLLKYSPNGDQLWNKSWTIPYGYDYSLTSGIAITKEHDVYISGVVLNTTITYQRAILVKFNNSGDYLWYKTWNGGMLNSGATGVALDTNENTYVSGNVEISGKAVDLFLIKYNSTGNESWNKTWGGTYNDYADGITVSSTNNLYMVGSKNDTAVDNNMMLLLKYNTTGSQQWYKTYGSGGYFGYGVAVSPSEEIYLSGSNPSGYAQLVKYDSSGNFKWNREPTYSGDFYGVTTSKDSNSIYATGHITGGPLTLVKYDKDGNFIWNTSWHSRTDGLGYSFGSDVAVNASGEIYVVGKTVDPPGDPNSKAVILKFVEVSVPEFTTIILPLTITMAIFIVISRKKRKTEWMPRTPKNKV
jgi:hypothetical protein